MALDFNTVECAARSMSPRRATSAGRCAGRAAPLKRDARLVALALVFALLWVGATSTHAEETDPVGSEAGQAADDVLFEGDDPSGDEREQAEEEDEAAVEDILEGGLPAEERADRHAGVEELVVTATKRAESVQDVPISVTALGGDFLEQSGTTNFADLQKFVPNLQILPVTDTRSTSIRIRGIGSVGTNAGIDPSVGVFIDGVYQGRAGMSVSDLLDIERVEVLRGPQGTLYGKNTAAGAINIITKNPTEEPSAFGETIVGNYNALEFRGSMDGPLVPEKLAGRVAGYKVTRKGFDVNRYDDERVNDADKWGVRGKLRWLGTEDLDVVLSGDYSVNDSSCCVGDIVSYQGPSTLGVTFDDLAAAEGIPLAPVDPFDRRVGANVSPLNEVSVGGVALDANVGIGSYDLRWLTSYRNYQSDSRFDGDFSVYDAVISATSVDFDQISSELLLVTPGGRTLEGQVGTYFYYSNLGTDDALGYTQLFADIANQTLPVPITSALNLNQNTHRTFDWAAFGQGTWNATELLSFTLGLRVDYEKKTRDGVSTSTCTVPAPPVCGPTDVRDEDRHVWSPQGTFIARLRPTDDVMVYASFANGFKSGGFNQLRTSEDLGGSPLKSEFDDERSFNYELGTKTTWFDGSVLANLTGYFTDYRQFQAQLFNGSSIVVDNAGRLFSWGIEAESRWVPEFVPDRGLMLGASLGLNFTEYQSFEGAPATVPQQAEIVAASPPGSTIDGISGFWCATGLYDCSQDLTGRRLDNAPRVTLTLFGSYERGIPGTRLVWLVGGDYLYETFKYLDTDLDSNLIQDPVHLLGLRTGFKTEDERLELTFWVNNTLDQGWLVAGADVPIVNGYMGVNAPPRTYGGTVRLRY